MKIKNERKEFIGGSDIAGILGISKWSTPLDIYYKKIEEFSEIDESKEKIFKRGKRMEPYIIDILSEENELEIIARNNRYTDKEHDFLSCEIDAEYKDTDGSIQNIEIKTASQYSIKEWEDGAPTYYVAQAMFGLMLTGRSKCIIAVLIGSDDFRTYTVERDEVLIKFIKDESIKFWKEHILKGVEPDPVSKNDVEKMFKNDEIESVDVGIEILSRIDRIKLLKDQSKELLRIVEDLEVDVKKAMGNASVALFNGSKIATWKTQTRNALDQKRIKSELPDLFKSYMSETNSRVFKIY